MPRASADPPLARLPARRHRLERLHARARARVEPRRARRRRRLPGAAARAVRPRLGARRRARAAGRAAAGVRARPLRGARGAAAPGLHAGGAGRATSRRTRPRCGRCCRPTSSSRTTSLLGGAGRARRRARRYAVKAHGSELEYSMRGNAELERWGRESLVGAHAVFVGSAHIRRVLEDVVGHVDRVHEVPPGVDVDRVRARSRATRRSPALLEEARRDPPNPGNRERAAAGRGQRRAVRGVLRRRRADRPLLRQADREQGRPGAVRGAARTRRARRHRRLRRLPRRRSRRRRRRGRSSPARSSTATSCTCCRSCDVAVVPSIFPEAFGMVAAEAAAAGVPPVVADHSGLAEVAAGLEREYPPGLAHVVRLRDRRRRRAARSASPSCSRSRRRSAATLGARRPPRRRAQLELGRASPSGLLSLHRLPAVGDEQKVGYEELLAQSRASLRGGPGLHPRRRGGVRAARPGDARPRQPLRGGAGGVEGHRRRAASRRRADRLGGRGADRPLRHVRGRDGADRRAARAAARAHGRARDRALRRRHASVEPLAGAADHRHAALPAERRAAPLRRLAQQHVRAPRARRGQRRRPRHPRHQRAAELPAGDARAVRELAVRRGRLHAPPLGAHADLHAHVPALRDPGQRSTAGTSGSATSASSTRPARSPSTRRSGGASGRTSSSRPSSSASATGSPTSARRGRSWR